MRRKMRGAIIVKMILFFSLNYGMDIKVSESKPESITYLSEQSELKVNIVPSRKSIGFIQALSMVICTIVGSGIFMTVKETFQVFSSKSIGMVVVFWLIGGVITMLGGLCYAELGTRIRKTGGEKEYFAQILDKKLSIVFVIFFVFLIKTLTHGALAVTTGKNIFAMLPESFQSFKEYIETSLAIATLLLCFIINSVSKSIAVKAGVVLTILKIIAVLIISGFGIYNLITGTKEEWNTAFCTEGFDLMKLGTCFISIFWAYEGSNTLGLIAGDMINPSRDLPLAIVVGISTIIILYVSAVVSYSSILGFDTAKDATTIAVDAMKKAMPNAYYIVSILICSSSAGATNTSMYAISSVSASAGYKGEIPRVFSLVHKKNRVPLFSLFVIFIISVCFTFIDFNTLLGYCAFISWIFYFLAYVSLWKIKITTRGEKLPGVFEVPYFLILPIQLVCIYVVGMCFYSNIIGCCVFSAMFVGLYALLYIPKKYVQFPQLLALENSFIKFCDRNLCLELARAEDFS
ncbi:hypothetical protein HZS_6957 [Henneguya salminicola]|nr:hypothetical protein HZS_6957 [Henneguya salminicola]